MELVHALEKAGLEEFVLDNVVGNGFLPGVTSPDQIADPEHPCKGAVPRVHGHFFTADGQFRSLDFTGQQVDAGIYTIIEPGTVVIDNGDFWGHLPWLPCADVGGRRHGPSERGAGPQGLRCVRQG